MTSSPSAYVICLLLWGHKAYAAVIGGNMPCRRAITLDRPRFSTAVVAVTR
jgi:hypothetical protein